MSRRAMPCAAALLAVALLAADARAQLTEVRLDRGAAADLYIRKRPPVPEPPRIPDELRVMLEETEKRADAKRTEAIGLLRAFLDSKPTGDGRAEALFKLAELLWEESRRDYVAQMDRYERRLEACRQERGGCRKPPVEPRLNLSEPETLYRALLADHPGFRRTDLVLYLVGFAAKEAERHDESLRFFQAVIERFPGSPLYGDSWMMIGEYYFATERWQQAREAYGNVLARPDAPTYDLALFKTAWCDWKVGEVELAARRFKQVLDLAVEAERSASAGVRRRRAQLRDEALEYLVIVFTEDQRITAQEVYDFLASIGGERYSRDVLVRLADAYYLQSEYERSVNTYRFLIEQRPDDIEAAAHQRRIVQANLDSLDAEQAIREMRILVDRFGPRSKWTEANRRNPDALKRSQATTEALVRTAATNFHAEAQQLEQRTKRPDLDLYRRAADAYGSYLDSYAAHPRAAQVRFFRAEILFFKLGRHEDAGDEYLAVGKTAPVGDLHRDALLKAMAAFEKARPANADIRGKRELSPVDRKFAESIDLYATLFPADPELVGVIFRNGQLFYDYGDYDEAIKRFGLIVTRYPDDPNAGPAGDRILGALARAEDYENIEDWARKLKQAKAFQSREQQQRLDRLIVESISKSGEKYAAAGRYAQAAGFYLRISREYPEHQLAPTSMFNAGLMLERARKPEEAATAYLALAERYPRYERAARAAFTAAQVYESMVYFDRAADAYEYVVATFARSEHVADSLFNAGVLRQALGQHKRAIEHYGAYVRRFKDRKDATEVAFRIGVVYEDAGDDGRADRAYRDYAQRYRRSGGPELVEAHTRAGRTSLRLGHGKRAARDLRAALDLYRKLDAARRPAARAWAAEARYLEGEIIYREYEALALDVSPRRLRRTLDQKTRLLERAQAVYLEVVEFGDLQWATAALFRIGNIYEGYAAALREAPTPPGLSEQDADDYRMELENYVIDIEERAIDLYATGYSRAISLEVYNQYTRRIREALGTLSSGRFPPLREARGRERVGDRGPAFELVTEVDRGP